MERATGSFVLEYGRARAGLAWSTCRVVALLAGVALASGASAEQVLEMKGTTVTGDPGLPKVLYIVPWQRPKLNNLDQGLVLHSLTDYVLEPVDPGLLDRERRYGSVYFGEDAGASAR